MNKKTAVYLFLGICIVLAMLLLTHTIDPIVGGSLFALALVILGGLSKGFRNNNQTKAQ
jgi:uncharacterized membrane protein